MDKARQVVLYADYYDMHGDLFKHLTAVKITLIDINGYLKAYVHQQGSSSHQGDRFGTRLKLSTQGEISKGASYFVAAKLELQRQFGDEDWETQSNIDSDEFYIDLSTADLDLRLGQQYIFWGRTTWVNPTDRFTAWNYACISGETEDYRITPAALRAQRYFSNERSLDMVWLLTKIISPWASHGGKWPKP